MMIINSIFTGVQKYLIPGLAVGGLTLAVLTVMAGAQVPEPARPIAAPARSPFDTFIAGAGLIEASSENIAIGTPVAGIVTDIFVKVGDRVRKDDPLFQIETRSQKAELRVRESQLESALRDLAKLEQAPRAEDVPPLEARVREAQSDVEQARALLALAVRAGDQLISEEILVTRQNRVASTQAALETAKANLALTKAGTWKPEIDRARAAVDEARARVEQTRVELERLTVRAPLDATVLQHNIRLGEYAQTGVLATPLLLLGNVDRLHIRTDVDENDAWRFQPNAKAFASVRGNSSLSTNLEFVSLEPYVVPKRSLTGESTERVDTRVMQVIYSFDRAELPIYVGQQMDVFIEVPATPATTAASLQPVTTSPKSPS